MDRSRLSDWIERYERAWRSPGTEALAELFTEGATYSTAPYENAHRGLEEIGAMWEAERSGPNEEFEMTSEVVAFEGETGVARVNVFYGTPKDKQGRVHRQRAEYRDLWVVSFDEDGRCSHFEEWPFWPPGEQGAPGAGAEV